MGKLIVIEGTDGSGKSTQFKLLTERLEREGRAFKQLEFPQYSEPSSALIKMYLGGQFGTKPSDVNAYAASIAPPTTHSVSAVKATASKANTRESTF